MSTATVNLVVRVPASLRDRARATADARGETISAIVRLALADYVDRAQSEPDDIRFTTQVLAKIAEGAPTYAHEDVWAEIARQEASGELPDIATQAHLAISAVPC